MTISRFVTLLPEIKNRHNLSFSFLKNYVASPGTPRLKSEGGIAADFTSYAKYLFPYVPMHTEEIVWRHKKRKIGLQNNSGVC